MKNTVIWYNHILTGLIVFSGTFVCLIDCPVSGVASKIIWYLLFNAMMVACFCIGPIVGFLASRIIMFGGLLIVPFYLIIWIGQVFGDDPSQWLQSDVVKIAAGWFSFSAVNTFLAKKYSDESENLFTCNFFS